MFMLIGEKRCPTCYITGKVWKKEPEVLVCPMCNAFYTEFGIVLESRIRMEEEEVL